MKDAIDAILDGDRDCECCRIVVALYARPSMPRLCVRCSKDAEAKRPCTVRGAQGPAGRIAVRD